MRAEHRLRKLEEAKGGGMFVGILEDRDGCERTECGTTHAPHQGVTYDRSDFSTDEGFWDAVNARTVDLGVTAVWIAAEHDGI